MNPAFGQQIKQADIDENFLSGPGEYLVNKFMTQLASVPGMAKIFGPYVVGKDQQRWADYQRYDWSIRQLPAINVFESQVEDKVSDNAWLNGTVTLQVFWPPSFRRSDLTRVPAAFKGVLENFFASKYVTEMLDELYYIQRPAKVYGLNEFGKVLNWTPNTEGIVESELVPVTIVDIKYRIDLRSWYRALEFMNRTQDDPFETSLADLTTLLGQYEGVLANGSVQVVVPDEITVTNP